LALRANAGNRGKRIADHEAVSSACSSFSDADFAAIFIAARFRLPLHLVRALVVLADLAGAGMKNRVPVPRVRRLAEKLHAGP
jgi:hypothetical protein